MFYYICRCDACVGTDSCYVVGAEPVLKPETLSPVETLTPASKMAAGDHIITVKSTPDVTLGSDCGKVPSISGCGVVPSISGCGKVSPIYGCDKVPSISGCGDVPSWMWLFNNKVSPVEPKSDINNVKTSEKNVNVPAWLWLFQ